MGIQSCGLGLWVDPALPGAPKQDRDSRRRWISVLDVGETGKELVAKGNWIGNCFADPPSSPSHQLPLPCKAQCRTKGKRFSFKWKNTLAEPLCSKLSHDRAKRGIGFLIPPFILSLQLLSWLLPWDRLASLTNATSIPGISTYSSRTIPGRDPGLGAACWSGRRGIWGRQQGAEGYSSLSLS